MNVIEKKATQLEYIGETVDGGKRQQACGDLVTTTKKKKKKVGWER